MNRYFYVPVMDPCVMHDGVTLRDHLKVVDYELYSRECKYYDDFSDFSFEDGILNAERIRNANKQNRKTDTLFRERNIPRFMVIVNSGERFYELASEVTIEPIDIDMLESFAITGLDVVEVFYKNPMYTPNARNFFESYEKNKEKLDELIDTSFKGKILRKVSEFKNKNW